jgi:hypothetical protein
MRRGIAFVLPLALGLAACGREPVAPDAMRPHDASPLQQKGHVEGSGLVLESLTGVTVPLLDALGVEVGDVRINQAVIKEFGTVENLAGQIIGLEATGVLELTGGVLGTDVVTQEFTTGVGVISSAGGQCDIITVDLAPPPVELDVLGETAFVQVPAAEVAGRGNGAVGSLLCNLGQLGQGLVNGVTRGVRGLVNALNRLLI